MQHSLIKYFNHQLELLPEEVEFLLNHVPVIDIKKNEYLLKEKEISTAFYFVEKGLIRMYYLVDGVEKTTYFYEANSFVSSYESFTKQIPSKNYIQAITNAKVAVFNMEVVFEILKKFPRFESLSRIVMEEELSIYQEMISSFITMDAKQRYLNLLKIKPHLLLQVPQYQIATYLGVSPETLSRIRARIKNK